MQTNWDEPNLNKYITRTTRKRDIIRSRSNIIVHLFWDIFCTPLFLHLFLYFFLNSSPLFLQQRKGVRLYLTSSLVIYASNLHAFAFSYKLGLHTVQTLILQRKQINKNIK